MLLLLRTWRKYNFSLMFVYVRYEKLNFGSFIWKFVSLSFLLILQTNPYYKPSLQQIWKQDDWETRWFCKIMFNIAFWLTTYLKFSVIICVLISWIIFLNYFQLLLEGKSLEKCGQTQIETNSLMWFKDIEQSVLYSFRLHLFRSS